MYEEWQAFKAASCKSVHGEPRSADEREGVLRRFSSIVYCVGIAVALSFYPRTLV